VNSAGTSPKSNELSATPNAPPSAPTLLTATPASNLVVLTWSASTGATSYNVYRGTSPGGEGGTAIASGIAGTTYTNTGLANGTIYYYKVAAVNSAGTSPQSNELSATPQAAPPPTPTGLTATPGNGSVSLSWNASVGAATYNVYRSTTPGGEGTTPLYSGVTGTSGIDTAVTNGTTYYYTVAAVNGYGTSAQSTEVSATPQGGAPPPAPTGLTATAGPSSGQITLTWNGSSGATSYNIYRGTSPNGEGGTPIASISYFMTYYVDYGLTPGTTYYYKVAAVGNGSTSPMSNEASAVSQ
jgi:fibronectin type 3 domain-containing protein